MDSHRRWPKFMTKMKNRTKDDEFEEEMISMVEEGQEQGVLKESEAEMIQKIFDFGDKQAGDIMTRRAKIQFLSEELTLQEAVDEILEEPYSRMPVCREDIDDVVGILHLRAAILADRVPENTTKKLSEIPGLLQEACFVPESKNINDLFEEMQKKKIQMELVIDEYGQTAGLVTMEDILEEIVGNIQDEFDQETALIQRLGDGSFQMDGVTPLSDVEEALGLTFEDEENETLNGFLVSRLNRIPRSEERPRIPYRNYLFCVESVQNKRIQSVRVFQTEEEKHEGEDV